MLHCRDPRQRPSAKEALKHPWLAGGTIADRYKGKPLEQTVVQRIQVRLPLAGDCCSQVILAVQCQMCSQPVGYS